MATAAGKLHNHEQDSPASVVAMPTAFNIMSALLDGESASVAGFDDLEASMAILLVILLGIAARFVIPGPRTLIGFGKTIIVGAVGGVAGSLVALLYLYATHAHDPLIKTNYGYESAPFSNVVGLGLVMSILAGAVLALIIYGFIVHSASRRTMTKT